MKVFYVVMNIIFYFTYIVSTLDIVFVDNLVSCYGIVMKIDI